MADISHKYQKDFSRAQFKDPRRIRDEEIKKKKTQKLLKILVLLVGVFLLYFFLFSDYFQIKTVEIKGINKISQQKFENILNDYRYSRKLLLFSRNNLLLFSKNKFRQRIGDSYLLESMKIDKDFPNTLKIEIQEKKADIILINDTQCMHLDDRGVVVEYCDGAIIEQLIKIKDLRNHSLVIGDQALKEDVLNYLVQVKQYLTTKIPIDLIYYNFESSDSIKIETGQNFDIYLNLELPYQDQLDRLFILLGSEEVKNQLNHIKYFDLRFGEKLYYQ